MTGGMTSSYNKRQTNVVQPTTTSASSQSQYENSGGTSTLQKLINSVTSANFNETERQTGTIVTDNMDPTTRAAYNAMLAQLQGGGSASQREATAALSALLANAKGGVEQWSQDAARQQAQKSMALYQQNMRETILPQLNAAMEAAGMSGDSLNALLAQDAAARTSAQAAAAEAALITQYGQLGQGQQEIAASVAAQMQSDPVMQMLANAINIGKGSLVTETRNLTTNRTGSSTQTINGSETSTGSETGYRNIGSSSYSSGTDLAAMLNANANMLNAQTNAGQAGSASQLDQMKALAVLQSIMPAGTNMVAGSVYNNAPVRGIPSAFNSSYSPSGLATQYGGINQLMRSLGLNV